MRSEGREELNNRAANRARAKTIVRRVPFFWTRRGDATLSDREAVLDHIESRADAARYRDAESASNALNGQPRSAGSRDFWL